MAREVGEYDEGFVQAALQVGDCISVGVWVGRYREAEDEGDRDGVARHEVVQGGEGDSCGHREVSRKLLEVRGLES